MVWEIRSEEIRVKNQRRALLFGGSFERRGLIEIGDAHFVFLFRGGVFIFFNGSNFDRGGAADRDDWFGYFACARVYGSDQ